MDDDVILYASPQIAVTRSHQQKTMLKTKIGANQANAHEKNAYIHEGFT